MWTNRAATGLSQGRKRSWKRPTSNRRGSPANIQKKV